ncbi:NADH-quinone oxidoreductase subunit C [Paenibacillus thiaminolyticus]|uniref:NADH-quinone oxidoreductase subunit C n=1 Tax=Paenibacillus thiaminolyticus TaxID=49283 RepID=UPI003D2A1654
MSEEKKDQEAVQPPLEAEKEEKAEPAKEAAAPAAESAPPAVGAGERAEAAVKPASEPAATEPSAPADKAKRAPLSEEEKAARLKAAEERRNAKAKAAPEGGADSAGAAGERPARAAAAAAGDKPERPARTPRAKASEEPPKPKEPSPKQPVLDGLVALLKGEVAEDAVEEAVINEENGHLPTITVKNEHWLACASLLRHHPEWSCSYLRNLAGVDHETYLEVVYYFINLSTKAEAAVHVKTDRGQPSIASVTPIWPTANWCEREVYDLLGIDFPGHPDLRRIMMPDDWVGHPLRKDYEPLDSEV